MVERCVLQEIMELNVEMSSMDISKETTNIFNHNPFLKDSVIVIQEFEKSKKACDLNMTEINGESNQIDENGAKAKPRRSLRKRIRPPDNNPKKQQDLAKVQKLGDDMGDIEKYYLCKKVKRLPSTLETIFEEPRQQNNKEQYLSNRKFKRTIQFEEDVARASDLKVRKRQMKAKKLSIGRGFLNRKKVSIDTLITKLSSIDSDKE